MFTLAVDKRGDEEVTGSVTGSRNPIPDSRELLKTPAVLDASFEANSRPIGRLVTRIGVNWTTLAVTSTSRIFSGYGSIAPPRVKPPARIIAAAESFTENAAEVESNKRDAIRRGYEEKATRTDGSDPRTRIRRDRERTRSSERE